MDQLTVLLAYWQADKWMRTMSIQGPLRLRRGRQLAVFDDWLTERRFWPPRDALDWLTEKRQLAPPLAVCEAQE